MSDKKKTPEPTRRAFPCAHPRPGVCRLTLGPAADRVNARIPTAVDRVVDDLGRSHLVPGDGRGTTCGAAGIRRPSEPRRPAQCGTRPCGRRIRGSGSVPLSSMGTAPMPALPPDVDVRRSRRRLRTVTAYREGDRTVVLIPARFTPAQEQEWVRRMLARLSAQDRRRRPGDADLAARAAELSRRYLGGLAE